MAVAMGFVAARKRCLSALTMVVLAAAAACGKQPASRDLQGPVAALDGLWPDGGRADAGPGAAPPVLRAFTCTKRFTAPKAPQGPLTIRFLPRSARDVTFHIEYHCQFNCGKICDYAADLVVEDGRMKNAGVSSGFPFKCVRSPLIGFAVDCGLFLGSDVDVHVRGNGVARTVSFRIPFFFDDHIPDRTPAERSYMSCMPFVGYDPRSDSTERKFLDEKQLVFPLDGCRFSSDDEN
jgi:hypothetical protein